jgi:hypothetical protein
MDSKLKRYPKGDPRELASWLVEESIIKSIHEYSFFDPEHVLQNAVMTTGLFHKAIFAHFQNGTRKYKWMID